MKLLLLCLAASLAFGQHVFPARGASVNHSTQASMSLATCADDGNGIQYHCGPVMLGTPTVNVIWYGGFTPTSPAVPIIVNLLQNIGGSLYEAINDTYHDGSGVHVSGLVTLGTQVYDAYSFGATLTDANIQSIVAAHVGHDLPVDTNAIYFVLTSSDVTESGPFGTFGGTYCGWHNWATINGLPIKFSFVGDASVRYPTACQTQTTGPNGSSGGDQMSNVIAHELEETISDPEITAWYDSSGNENADKCAWTFGTTYLVPNGSKANMVLGGLNYLIQQNWVNAAGGYCSLRDNSAVLPKVTLITPAPNSTYQCDANNQLTMSVTSTAVDYLGEPIANRTPALGYEFRWGTGSGSGLTWCPGCGDYTFTVACEVPGYPGSQIVSGEGLANATDVYGNTSGWKTNHFSVLPKPVPPPPPPPPPPPCTKRNHKACH